MFLGCTLWFVDFSLSRQYSKANNELDVVFTFYSNFTFFYLICLDACSWFAWIMTSLLLSFEFFLVVFFHFLCWCYSAACLLHSDPPYSHSVLHQFWDFHQSSLFWEQNHHFDFPSLLFWCSQLWILQIRFQLLSLGLLPSHFEVSLTRHTLSRFPSWCWPLFSFALSKQGTDTPRAASTLVSRVVLSQISEVYHR